MKRRQAGGRLRDHGKIIKKLLAIPGTPGNPSENMAKLLMEESRTKGCIICSLSPGDGHTITKSSLFGQIPHRIKISDEEKDVLIRDITKIARRSIKYLEETGLATLKLSDKDVIGIIATLIPNRDKIPTMIVMIKADKPYEGSRKFFIGLKPHILFILNRQ